MKKIAVIYQSKYGATKQYVTWIAEELKANLLERSAVTPQHLMNFDVVVYGGGLYAGGIAGVDLVAKHPCRKLVVFTVGLANPDTTDYSEILNRNFTGEQLKKIKLFHLRGAMDYSELGMVHRGMMALMKKMTVDAKAEEALTEEDHLLIDTYGKSVDFMDKASVKPLIDYVRSIEAMKE